MDNKEVNMGLFNEIGGLIEKMPEGRVKRNLAEAWKKEAEVIYQDYHQQERAASLQPTPALAS
jgi:hypothetical protein